MSYNLNLPDTPTTISASDYGSIMSPVPPSSSIPSCWGGFVDSVGPNAGMGAAVGAAGCAGGGPTTAVACATIGAAAGFAISLGTFANCSSR